MNRYQHKWMFKMWIKIKCKRLYQSIQMSIVWMTSESICITR